MGAAALPVIVASLFGDDALSPIATAGVLLGLLAIGLVSMARSEQRGSVGSSVLYGLGGAAGVGMLLVCLANTAEDSGLWPIVAARGSGFVVLAVIIAAKRFPLSTSRGVWPHVIGIAALVTAGNALFLTAARLGSTSVAAVLASLFPAATVFWAWLVFRERLRKVQAAGTGNCASGRRAHRRAAEGQRPSEPRSLPASPGRMAVMEGEPESCRGRPVRAKTRGWAGGHHSRAGGCHRQRGQLVAAGRRGSGRGHPPGSRPRTARVLPWTGRLRHRRRQDHARLPAGCSLGDPHRRSRLAWRQPG